MVAGRSSRQRTTTWAVITHRTPAATAAANGARSRARYVASSTSIDRQRDVGVDPGGAVAREVLGAGGHTAGLQPTHERRAVPRHQLGVGAERPLADHPVVGLGAHVDDRRQHHVDAEVAGAGTEARGDPGGGAGVVERAQRGVPGPRRARCRRRGG